MRGAVKGISSRASPVRADCAPPENHLIAREKSAISTVSELVAGESRRSGIRAWNVNHRVCSGAVGAAPSVRAALAPHSCLDPSTELPQDSEASPPCHTYITAAHTSTPHLSYISDPVSSRRLIQFLPPAPSTTRILENGARKLHKAPQLTPCDLLRFPLHPFPELLIACCHQVASCPSNSLQEKSNTYLNRLCPTFLASPVPPLLLLSAPPDLPK